MFDGNGGVWGHRSTFQLVIVDNHRTQDHLKGLPYENGLPREDFYDTTRYYDNNAIQIFPPSHITDNYTALAPNGTNGPDTWGLYHPDGWGSPTANFVDYNGYESTQDMSQYFPNGSTQMMFNCKQRWHCMERTWPQRHMGYCPPNNTSINPRGTDFYSDILDTTLSNDHTLIYQYRDTLRAFQDP